MEFIVPKSLKLEHDELHAELAMVIKVGGKIGDSAKAVAEILHPHFVKEEEYAMPPLGLLSALAEGEVTAEMKNVLPMTDRLQAELPEMLKEHKTIISALISLMDVAMEENKMEYVRFADKLMLHAQNEEEVLYPASMLVGKYLKLEHAATTENVRKTSK